ncbi:subfamily B ATP-binding cassette protein MsbA [Ereboglobus sp. PH5-10]|uniref:ABC transporter ATP-binding protein n=1 Tax=Ereboglobus sp. PH5-10 TaxID=2940629 RepID=UPI002406D6AB|nr:ABC transporter ATP-binding protein [Ereboglobus sp. PH5-10]MDF9825962.1 subfamily B ATP-binding cassette protein MsbA [Ereboglobus sp. PH5-10]
MKRFIPYYSHLKQVRWPFIGGIFFGICFGISSGFGIPFMLKKVLPALFPDTGEGVTPLVLLSGEEASWMPAIIVPEQYVLIVALFLLPVTFSIRGISQFLNAYLLNYAGLRVLESIRADIFAHLQFLHLDYFRKHKSGDLISRVSNDTTVVKGVIVEATNDILIQPFTLIGAMGYLVWETLQHPEVLHFLACLLVVPLCILPIRYVGKKTLRKSQAMLGQAGELNAILTESLQSPRDIRAYNLEQREISRFRQQVRKFFKLQLKVVKYDKMLSPIIEVVAAFGISLAIYQIHGSGLDQESVIALIGALYFAYTPIKKLGGLNNRIRQGESALNRIEEVLYSPIEVASPATPAPIPAGGGDVAFENVTFGYDPENPILKDVNIGIRTGEIVALVGATGAGKSTFINLIPRFYDVTSGRITLNGIDLRKASLADLRSHIALVSQQPILFNDTIYNNILLGRPDASRAEVEEAARRAYAFEFITGLPEGWETIVGERGDRLSGGQRQRIAIARAFLRNAPILILDEATSALDTESEAQVQGALEELTRGKTTFIIAHRFSTIRNATKILVLDQGRIIATGTHAELYQDSPVYKNLYDLQTVSAG